MGKKRILYTTGAEIYKEGNKWIIRLGNMDFAIFTTQEWIKAQKRAGHITWK